MVSSLRIYRGFLVFLMMRQNHCPTSSSSVFVLPVCGFCRTGRLIAYRSVICLGVVSLWSSSFLLTNNCGVSPVQRFLLAQNSLKSARLSRLSFRAEFYPWKHVLKFRSLKCGLFDFLMLVSAVRAIRMPSSLTCGVHIPIVDRSHPCCLYQKWSL